MRVHKTLSIDLEVVQRLDDEENQSRLVEELLRDHYDMEEEDDR